MDDDEFEEAALHKVGLDKGADLAEERQKLDSWDERISQVKLHLEKWKHVNITQESEEFPGLALWWEVIKQIRELKTLCSLYC